MMLLLTAVLIIWFTFLPSFVFILAGGPLVESTHGNLRLTAPLTAITAAVVGVIVNLALFFGYHTLWLRGFTGVFDPVAAVLLVVSALALFRWKQSVIRVVVASAAVGLLLKLLPL
jgi:chromate transporter